MKFPLENAVEVKCSHLPEALKPDYLQLVYNIARSIPEVEAPALRPECSSRFPGDPGILQTEFYSWESLPKKCFGDSPEYF